MSRAKTKSLPPLSLLRERFDYDPETGRLVHRTNRGAARMGADAGCVGALGYLQVRIDGSVYKAHRLCYALGTNVPPAPEDTVDHVNGDRLDNRLVNLRLATSAEQKHNGHRTPRRTRDDSECLPRGVALHRTGKYLAYVGVTVGGRRRRFQRVYPTWLQAGYAAALAREHYHGEFANHGVDTPESFSLFIDPPDIEFPDLE